MFCGDGGASGDGEPFSGRKICGSTGTGENGLPRILALADKRLPIILEA